MKQGFANPDYSDSVLPTVVLTCIVFGVRIHIQIVREVGESRSALRAKRDCNRYY